MKSRIQYDVTCDFTQPDNDSKIVLELEGRGIGRGLCASMLALSLQLTQPDNYSKIVLEIGICGIHSSGSDDSLMRIRRAFARRLCCSATAHQQHLKPPPCRQTASMLMSSFPNSLETV